MSVHLPVFLSWFQPALSYITYLQTAAHEFGHSLGLKHSRDRTSLMAPYHPGLLQEIKLKDDDIEGITKLYGKLQLTLLL